MTKPRAVLLASIVCLTAVMGATGWLLRWSPDAKIKAAVLMNLVDPDSASFGPITVGPSKLFGCGTVNAKNRMGGFAGHKAFIAGIDGNVEFQPEARDAAGLTALEGFTERAQLLCFHRQ